MEGGCVKKKIALVLIVVIVLMSLTGCTGSDTKGGGVSDEPVITQSTGDSGGSCDPRDTAEEDLSPF